MKGFPTPNVHVCGKCSLNHFTKDCESFESLCINCVRHDTAGADQLTSSYNCPSLKIQKELSKGKKHFKLNKSQPQTSSIKCCMWNVTSMISRTPLIREHLLDRNPSIVFISETWLKTGNNHVTTLVKTYNYILLLGYYGK